MADAATATTTNAAVQTSTQVSTQYMPQAEATPIARPSDPVPSDRVSISDEARAMSRSSSTAQVSKFTEQLGI